MIMFVLPFYVVFAVAFGTVDFGNFGAPVPYYAPWWWSFDTFDETLSKFYAGTAIYQAPLFRTFVYVSVASVICLVLGYTVAYFAARGATKFKGLILILLVSPLWISYLMRIYAWQGLLETDGPINLMLGPVGLGRHELARRHARDGDPGPRLRLHPVHDPADIRLARPYPGEPAGGRTRPRCAGTQTFWRVTLPLSRPAILAGIVIVTLPMFGDYYTTDLLGSTKTSMFGNLIAEQRLQNGGSTRMSSLVLILAVIVLVPMLYYLRETKRAAEQA